MGPRRHNYGEAVIAASLSAATVLGLAACTGAGSESDRPGTSINQTFESAGPNYASPTASPMPGEVAPSAPESAVPSPTDLPSSQALGALAEKSCVEPRVRVFPGSRLNADNISSIGKQITALEASFDKKAKATPDNVADAMALIANASVDSDYANAMAWEKLRKSVGLGVVPAGRLLDQEFNRPECLTTQQIQQVAGLSEQLVTSYGEKIGRQSGVKTKALYNKMRDNWSQFKQKHPNLLGY